MPPSDAPPDRARAEARARPYFRAARRLGGILLLVSAALLATLPQQASQLPPGMRTPIIAFELATTRAEVEALFGPSGSDARALRVRQMDLGNRIDFAFMAGYGAFLTCIGLGAAHLAGARLRLVAVLAPLSALFDVVENVQLLAITRKLGSDYTLELHRLQLFTWLKWGTLAACLVWLTPWLLRGTRSECFVGALGALSGGLAAFAYVDRARFAEAFTVVVSLSFVGLWAVAFQRARFATRP